MKKEIRVYDIKWYYNYDPTDETYPKEEYDINFNAAPTEMIIDITDWDFGEIVDDVDSIDEDLSNYISYESGYYHKGFKWEYVKQTITGVITRPKSHLEQAIEFATKMCEIKDLIEEDKTILNNPEYISMMKEYNFTKNN